MKDHFKLNPNDADYIPFPELGSGSQFHAYDLHNGRVLKLPLTREETAVVIAKRRHNMLPLSKEENASVEARVQTVVNGKARIPTMVEHSLYDQRDFLTLLGNPTLISADNLLPEDTPDKQWGAGRVIYTQDKLAMVGDMLNAFAALPTLKQGDASKLRQIIDLYVEQTYKMWEFGYADYVFKLGDTGFDTNNKLILADLGEYSSDPGFIAKALADRRWLHATDPSKIDFPQIPAIVQDYYTKTLDNAFTLEALQTHWRKRHRCSSCYPLGDDAISTFIASKVSEIDFVDRW